MLDKLIQFSIRQRWMILLLVLGRYDKHRDVTKCVEGASDYRYAAEASKLLWHRAPGTHTAPGGNNKNGRVIAHVLRI